MNTEKKLTLAKAVDPKALGKIHNIVNAAHKWGGDGHRPLFRRIRTVLLKKHPEVIAKAFGGDPNVAAAWIKNNWYRLRGQEPPPTRGGRPAVSMSLDRDFQEVPLDLFGENAAELFSAASAPSQEGDLVWVTGLRTGEWQVNPILGKQGPLKIDKQFMDDVMQAWREGAWEYVTVPSYHTDNDPLANTGFVRDLKITRDGSQYLLRCAVQFTEPEVAEKVMRGSVAGVSVNVKFNVKHQESGKVYPKVLTHLALTNIPFINGLDAFSKKLAADKEATPDEVVSSYELLDPSILNEFTEAVMTLATGLFDEDRDYQNVVEEVQDQLGGYGFDGHGKLVLVSAGPAVPAVVRVKGITPEKVLLHAYENDDTSGYGNDDSLPDPIDLGAEQGDDDVEDNNFVAGYKLDANGEVTLDPLDKWVLVEQQWVKSDEAPEVDDYEGVKASVPMTEENTVEIDGISFMLIPESPKGGDDMPDEDKKEPDLKPQEDSKSEEVTMTRAEIDELAKAKADEVLTAYRTEQDAKSAEYEGQLTAMRKVLHEKDVTEKVAELVAAGHAPTVVKKAQEILLADSQNVPVLSLTRDNEEVKLSASDIVTELLSSIPATALTATNVDKPDLSRTPEDAKSRADELYEELFGDNKKPAISLS